MKLNILKSIPSVAGKVARVTAHNLKKASPDILIVVGVAGVIVSTVMACKATRKANDIIDEHNLKRAELDRAAAKEAEDDDIFAIDDDETEEGAETSNASEAPRRPSNGSLFKLYRDTGWQLFRVYGPSMALGAASIACVFASHGIMKKRNAGLLAAYSAVEKGFAEYRKKVKNLIGDEAEEKLRLGEHEEEIEVTEVNEDGEEVTIRKLATIYDIPEGYSRYARYFDQFSIKGVWQGESYTDFFLDGQEAYANDLLIRDKWLTFNTVLRSLGLPECSDGQNAGWAIGAGGDDKVIFTRKKGYRRLVKDGMETIVPTIVLDFNVDGDIHEYIDQFNAFGEIVKRKKH